jgi:uncharacterized protein YndB with AHSA1/START domain
MRVVETVVTSASPELVWQVLADVEHWRDWTPTVLEIKSLGNALMEVGSQYRVVQPKLRPANYEVTEYVPHQRFTWAQKLPGGALVADHRITPRDGATEVELSFTSQGLLANMVAAIFSKMIAQYVATESRSLKTYCDVLSHRRAS